MTEAFLHYIWQYQYFDKKNLLSTAGESISILKNGFYNTHAGPDFTEAKIVIDTLEWIGNIEIHLFASDWQQHKHQHNKAYDNVILHVVWHNDTVILRSDGTLVPTLELKGRISEKLLLNYQNLVNAPATIPCASSLHQVNSLVRLNTLDRALAQRLEAKAQLVLERFHRNKQDWEETFYQLLGRNFGFKVNNDAFERLVEIIPFKAIRKHANDSVQIEAMLFGVAGMLSEPTDEYANLLQREYQLLSSKFEFKERQLPKSQWRFLRLRPANFPTLRIAQFASLLLKNHSLFSIMLATESIHDLKQYLTVVQSAYWQEHYQFEKKAQSLIPALGNDAIENIIINTIVPTLAAYSLYKDETLWMDRAINFLSKLSPEKNSIIKQWMSIGWSASSAYDSQGLLELQNSYCNKRLCLQCSIGHSLIRST